MKYARYMQRIDNAILVGESQKKEIIYYFGYGANRSKQRLTDILEQEPIGGYGAYIQNFALCYQLLVQIPPGPREILEKCWGRNFRCYTLRKRNNWVVAGVIWELTKKQFEILKKWELIGSWKKLISVEAIGANGTVYHTYTELVPDPQPVYQDVDGLQYENNLNAHKNRVIKDEYRILKAREILHVISKQSRGNG